MLKKIRINFKDSWLYISFLGLTVIFALSILFGKVIYEKTYDYFSLKNEKYKGMSKNQIIASRTLDWVTSQINDKERNIYSSGCICTNSTCKKCENKDSIPRVSPFVIWGRAKYIEKTGDKNEMVNLNKDVQSLIDQRLTEYNDYSCKLMEDLYHSSIFSEKQKDNFVEICRQANYEQSPALATEYKIKDEQFEKVINQIIDGETVVFDTSFVDREVLKNEYDELAAFVSDIVSYNKFGIDRLYGTKNMERPAFYSAIQGYLIQDSVNIKDTAMLGIASLDMYQSTKNQIFYNFAKFLYGRTLSLEKENPNAYDDITFALFTYELNKLSGQAIYKTKLNQLIGLIIKYGYDSPDTMAHKASKKAFIDSGSYMTKENGLIVGLISISDAK